MASFTAGTTFVDGVSNDVTAAKLGALVTNATPTSGFIQDRTAETVIATNDTLLIGDASDSNNLKRITVANFTQTLPTAKVTTGTIETGTFGTTTSTAATITALTTGTGTAEAPAIVPTGDTNTGIFFPAADTIAFSDGGAESMRINSSGNVGIGISPSQKLDVNGGSAIRGTLFIGDGSSSLIRKLTSSTPLTFANNGGSAEMTIDSSGNVGIGVASPSGPLHIRGAAGRFAFPATSGATQSNGLTLRLNDASDDNAILDIGGNSTSGYWLQATNNANLATNYPLLLNPNGGNVGIGVTSPAVKLDVSGGNIQGKEIFLENGAASSPALGTTPSWYSPASGVAALSTNAAERLRIDSSGNCSIGTATALSKLHVHGDLTMSNATTAVTAATGGVSKPATYAGFLTVSINGTSRKIPYYA